MTTKPIPDHLCSAPSSPYFDKDFLDVRVSVNGIEVTGTVLEYNVPKGWAMVLRLDKDGEAQRGRRKRPSSKMLRGKVVVWRPTDDVPEGAILPGTPKPERRYSVPMS